MLLDQCDADVTDLIERYIGVLQLPTDRLRITTSRETYRRWLGRRVPSAYGGAYCFLRVTQQHAILINLERIDTSKPHAVEAVVAEELVHMRDHLDGDHRRHAHHGYDRIAQRVAELVGISMAEVGDVLKPVNRRPLKYIYECPGCGYQVGRRKRGIWSCGRCSPTFNRRFQMRIVEEIQSQEISRV